ncbi:MAG: hypothetical protein K0B07_02800 [DPANN group archaeon]|nr:hypothetical protein [DPANN group archaeon]
MGIVGYEKGKIIYGKTENESGDPNKTLCHECNNEVKMERSQSNRFCPICGAVFKNLRIVNIKEHTDQS